MNFIATLFLSAYLVFNIAFVFYLIFPKFYFIYKNGLPAKRLTILWQMLMITITLFILFAITVPNTPEQIQEGADAEILPFFIGFFGSIILLYWLGKTNYKKYGHNIVRKDKSKIKWVDKEKSKAILDDAKKDWQKLKSDLSNKKQEIKNDWNSLKESKQTKAETKLAEAEESKTPAYKEPTLYVSPPPGEYQPWNQIPDFAKKKDDEDDDLDEFEYESIDRKQEEISGFRYALNYKDRNGNVTTRGVDITKVYKVYGYNRWYFKADTLDGERTFKSERVISLRDQWFNKRYSSSKTIREYLLSEYDAETTYD